MGRSAAKAAGTAKRIAANKAKGCISLSHFGQLPGGVKHSLVLARFADFHRDCNLGSIFRFCLGVWRFDPGPNLDQSQPQGTSAARAEWGADETVFVEKVMKGKHSGMWESHTPCLLQNQPPESFAGAASL